MIGYYVHHVGRGHLHRAAALAATLGRPVTGLSSLPRPDGWDGDWIELERDDATGPGADPTAHGALHWVPEGDPGLLDRMSTVSQWCAKARPELLISDVSVEVALLARLHGIRVLSVVLPGERTDPAHRLGFAASAALVSFWPESADGMVSGLGQAEARWHRIGAMSRYGVSTAPAPGRRQVVVLNGGGGTGVPADLLEAARAQTPDWTWRVLGPGGEWVADPFPALLDADVVVTHAGQNALAEVASARRPAIVVPDDRPHAEQRTTAGVLARGPWPALVETSFPVDGWARRLATAAALDGADWADWCDGRAAERFAALVDRELAEGPR